MSIVGDDTYYEYLQDFPLHKAEINLKTYSGHEVKLLGQVEVNVVPLVNAKCDGTSLFGRSWIAEIERHEIGGRGKVLQT